ncbi:hypothetical protein Q9295_17670 [Xinfangfangia sp. CPCC 101601]|uniref:DUF4258 domain-containing protein n=1 Tax=Pseudogemmobacter lacusdianii TaxID=3069608 RepID=A0ABU0W2E8_9RHOB|nr:hypothetical protein [Xinfangfangia sp. CPCC 101601]MDQ2068199.1 hypothetical protein [Xinfangfangia sp. CPCC 101601]
MSIHMSNHGRQRGQQRGIQQNAIALVMALHDVDHVVGDDCRALRVSRREVAAAGFAASDRQILERLCDVTVVWSDRHNQVVTAFKSRKSAKMRRYLGRG